MKISQLRYFMTVCRYNNITKAAEELYVSQPAISSSIKDLETEFGVKLFYRQNNKLLLTDEGEYFLDKVGYSGRGGHSFYADEGPRKQPQPHQNRRSVHGGHLSVSRYVQRLQGEISRNRGGNAGVRLLAGCKERGKQHA